MNKLTLALTFLMTLAPCLSLTANGQDMRFGKVSEEEVSMTSYEKDPQAEALYIYDKRELSYTISFLYEYNVYMRIKVFDKNALDLANVQIPFYSAKSEESVTGLAANTYNMVDGKMVKTPMPKQNIFKEKVSDDFTIIKFSLPEVREGSVIEYKYTLRTSSLSGISDFNIQRHNPVLHSIIDVRLPEFIGFSVHSRGTIPLNIKQGSDDRTFPLGPISYNVKLVSCHNDDVPSLRNEPMVWCLDDFLAGFDIEVISLIIPEAGIYENFAGSWESINETLRKSDLGAAQRARNPFGDEVKAIRSKDTTETAKMREVLKLVNSRIKFNDQLGLMPNMPGSVARKGVGDMADINNILSLALRDCGFKTDLILLSPRSEGRLPMFPTMKKISAFVVRAFDSQGNAYFMDASDKDSDLNVLSPDLLVDKARVYETDGPGSWVNLTAPVRNTDQMIIYATLENDGSISGNLNRVLTNQKAYELAKLRENAKSEEEFIEELADDMKVSLDSCSFSGIGTSRAIETFNFRKNPDKAGEFIYINPTLYPFLTENPFNDQARKLPVEFDSVENTSVRFILVIPEGYTVEEIPEPCSYTACEGDVTFSFIHQRIGNNLSVRLALSINRIIFSVEEYSDLNIMFGKIAELCNSRIVIKKVQ